MKTIRDLDPEIDHAEAVARVGSTIAEFMDIHHGTTPSVSSSSPSIMAKQKSLLDKIQTTHNYIRPLLRAMELEGSYHMATPRYLCNEEENAESSYDGPVAEGSPWAAKIQHDLAPSLAYVGGSYANTTDEYHQSWWINPFADPPFYHPQVNANVHDDCGLRVEMKTVSEAVYEKTDLIFDGGFFSNSALEIRTKFNSPQAILKAAGVEADFEPVKNVASQMNANTIEWAWKEAPEVVQRRYERRGVKLYAGKDIEHQSGPGWIWSYLNFRRGHRQDGNGHLKDCMYIDSHTMVTPLDHPVPFAGGKLYCKLLSPAKALDWMYTDSLRPVPSVATFLVRHVFDNNNIVDKTPSYIKQSSGPTAHARE